MIVSHLMLILHKKIQLYIFMFESWNVAKGRKVQGGRILSQGTVLLCFGSLSCCITQLLLSFNWSDREPYILLQNVLINLGIHFCVDDGKLSRPWGSKAAPNHDAPSTILYSGDEVLLLVCCAFFSPHIGLCVPSKQLNFSLICPQNILPVALWNIQVLFCILQTCSNVFFGQKWLLPWCPPINTIHI